MLLKSLTLNPFAGFANRTFEFTPGLNVLLGPNEAGKSTMINALFGVLQLAEKPVGFDADMKQLYLPRTGGDFFRVVLEFEAGGEEYTLKWKLSGKTALELENRTTGAQYDQDTTVRQRLAAFKHYHHDVYQDVLVIRQGALEEGSGVLSNDGFSGKGADQLLDRLRQRTVAGGGFSPEAMLRRLEVFLGDTAEGYPGQWDFGLNRPLGNRGLDNPWRNKVGLITQSWYAWKQAEKNRLEVEDTVHRLERLTTENEEAQQKLAQTRVFVEERREEFESRDRLSRIQPELDRWEQSRKNLLEKQREAESHTRELGAAREALSSAKKDVERLQAQESGIAEAKILGEMQEVVRNTDGLVREYRDANAQFRKLPEVPKEALATAKALDRELITLDAKLKAVQLSLMAEAISGTATIWVEGEGDTRREVKLAGGQPFRQTSAGRVVAEVGGVRLHIQPDKFDAEAILKQKEEKAREKEGILSEYKVASIDELEAAHAQRAELERRCTTLTQTITQQTNRPEFRRHLDVDTVKLRDLETALAGVDLSLLPDPKTWAVAMAQARAALAKPEADVRRLEDWLNRNSAAKIKTELEQAEAKAAELVEKATQEPWFGKDLDPADAGFLDRYRRAQSELTTLTQSLAAAGASMAALEQQLDGRPDLPELKSREQQAHTAYEARLQEYQAYKTIRTQLAALMEESDMAVFGPVRERLSQYISMVTGSRYTPAEFQGSELVPERFVRGRMADFQLEHLSQGTGEAIALATRLALAEFYLDGRRGFLVLDDVMVNMDPERVVLASALIREFATRFQVLYCTCHPAHAGALGGNRLAMERMG